MWYSGRKYFADMQMSHFSNATADVEVVELVHIIGLGHRVAGSIPNTYSPNPTGRKKYSSPLRVIVDIT